MVTMGVFLLMDNAGFLYHQPQYNNKGKWYDVYPKPLTVKPPAMGRRIRLNQLASGDESDAARDHFDASLLTRPGHCYRLGFTYSLHCSSLL